MKFENKILLAAVPALSQLKYFHLTVDYNDKENENNLSNCNWRKIKTRNLIKSYDDILAAPSDGWVSYIHLIVTDEDSSKLKYLFNNHQIASQPLQENIYLRCIFHTISVKLSPDWNQVKQYFVKGQNFLSSKEMLECVKFQLALNDSHIVLLIRALRLKIRTISLINLAMDLEELNRKGHALIRQKVYVLPDLKEATIVSVHLNLPKFCPFKNYSDLRNHWKILYNYNLPENEDGMAYIEVIFDRSYASYIYPIVCVCPYEPFQFRVENELQLISEFLDILKRKCPTLCGWPLKIHFNQNNIYHPVCKIYFASKNIEKPNLETLSEKTSSETSCMNLHSQNNQSNHDKINTNEKPAFGCPKFLPINATQTSFKRKLSEETFKCFPIFTPKKKHSEGPKFTQNIFVMKTQKALTPSLKKTSQNEEVKIMALSKNLKKLTLPVLMSFCKENDISLKAKDKKEIVIQKIYEFISKSPTN